MVVLAGIVGTGAALVGIAEHLFNFFVVLGLLVPPVASVYLCDFFVFRRTDFSSERLEGRPTIVVNAVVAGIGSGILSVWMYFSDRSLTSIAPLDSLVIGIVAYLLLEFARMRLGKK